MKPGQLVRFVDYLSGGGFAPPEESIGIVISVKSDDVIPPALEVLLCNGSLVIEWQDEFEVLNV